jgi:predicted nucleic acid-binding Zn ribbon protein
VEDLIKSLPQVLRATGDSEEVAEAAALAAWKHVAGEGLRDHAAATRLEEKTLVVEVRDAIWQKQLAMMKRQLIFRVNSTLGQPLVKDIELRIIPKVLSAAPAPGPANTDLVDNEVPLELWSAASAIEDTQLRQKFLKAAMGALRRNVR